MDRLFSFLDKFESDFYIADYTRIAESDDRFKGRGVEVSSVAPEIAGLCFLNPHRLPCYAANFEKNHAVFETVGGKVKQCECACFAQGNKPWLAFVEMKYCQEKNFLINAQAALAQVEATYDYLSVNYADHLNSKKYKVYFIVSIPEHSMHSPFLITQDDKLRLLERKIILIDGNRVEIRTASHIFQL